MKKLRIFEEDGKEIDFVIECPKRFEQISVNASGRIRKINGEFQFVPRGNNWLKGTRLCVEELEAIITKLKELNSS